MDNRGLSLGLGVLVALVIGVGSAFGYHQVKNSQTAVSQPSPSPQESPSPSSSPAAASPSPSLAASPSPSPSASPSASPSPTNVAVSYPSELAAGQTYQYSGNGTLLAGAQDSADRGTSVCAAINDSTQSFPAGYEGVFFVAIMFTDGNRISAGFQRSASGRQDFGTVQTDHNPPTGNPVPGPASGTHTYCVSHSGSNWIASDDGKTIFSTTVETSTASNGQLLFESSAQHFDTAKPVTAFSLVVPGIHDITVDGKPPTQLRGFTTTF
jgi:hypothetical protein